MLGRLRMTTQEALQAYNNIAQSVFCKGNKKYKVQDGTFKSATLQKGIKDVVAEKNLGERMSDHTTDADIAKTFVCAIPAVNMAGPRLFRSYQVRENASADCMIWEAARATTAAPTFFKQVVIEDDRGVKEAFLDAGLRFNNPAGIMLTEAHTLFGGGTNLGCLVSIGTGHPGIIGLPKPDAFQKMLPTGLVNVLKDIATDCERTAADLARRFRKSSPRYARFSVSHGIGRISLEEWKRMHEVSTHTKAYMEELVVSERINEVVKILCHSDDAHFPKISLQSACQ